MNDLIRDKTGRFIKGYRVSKEIRAKISQANQGRKLSKETRKKMSIWRIGKKLSKEIRLKISKAHKGMKKPWVVTTGKAQSGPKSHWWKGGIATGENAATYKSFHTRLRQLRKREVEGEHSIGEWELLKKQYGFTCPACKRKEPEIKLTEDHIIPISKGGSNWIENIQPLCRNCNSRKNVRMIKYE